jgi:dTDP-4-amino-4,6-dideoxygalactose transaminase
MRVPLLDLSEQYQRLAEPIRREIGQVLASQQFILGPKLTALEAALAEYCRAPHVIGVSSGTDALLALLMALGVGRGDAVITTAFSFFATGGCIARVGATPVFVDIDPCTCNISPAAVEQYITAKCRRSADGLRNDPCESVRAILPVHLFGCCADMRPLLETAQRERLLVIEDAAQAIGAEYPLGDERPTAGTMGDCGSLSFYPTKNLGAAGDAGAVICREPALAHRLRLCRQHGMEERYFHKTVGGNFRLDEMQAAILRVKLPHLDAWSAARRAAAARYREKFAAAGLTTQITLPAEPYRDRGLTNHHVYHQFVIRTAARDSLREHLTRRDIGTAIYYPLGLHQQECFHYLGYRGGDLPETERAAREVLALPIFPEISDEQQDYVVRAIAEFFQ